MQGVKRANGDWKSCEGACKDRWGHFQEGDSPYESPRLLAVGICKLARTQADPHLIFEQSAGDEGLTPKGDRRATVFGEKMGECNRCIDVDHRSPRSSSSSARRSRSGATGFDGGGGSSADETGSVNQPLRTDSASIASARKGLSASRGGPISATTRSRSVTRIVSPDAAKRRHSFSRPDNSLRSTDFMGIRIASGSCRVNVWAYRCVSCGIGYFVWSG